MNELREMEEEAARLGSGISDSTASKRQLMAGAWGRYNPVSLLGPPHRILGLRR